jgi:hypothetical protein
MTKQLKDKIRYAKEPDNPALLSIWLTQNEGLCLAYNTEKQWQAYLESVQLLLETYADTMNPAHWRATCLDHLTRPLSCLQRIANSPQRQRELQKLLIDINRLSHYFSPNFIQQDI